jgi:hypothetical protein
MTASLLLAAAILLPAQEPDRPFGPPSDKFTPDPAWKVLDKKNNSLFFDPRDRRLIVRARVCIREGFLEHLLCSDRTKEHESILATTASPQAIQAGLILTGAEPGHPVQYKPKFAPPAGTAMSLTVEWVEDGKSKTLEGKTMVLDSKTKKPLDLDWVFAGSDTFADPDDPKKVIFAADGGDLFTVANFTAAILDLPIASSGNDDQRSFVANTDKIPPKNTYVSIILRPIKAAKAAK